jgi:hypothetical protein
MKNTGRRENFFCSIPVTGLAKNTEVNIAQGGEGPMDKMLLQIGTVDNGYAVAYLTDSQAKWLVKAIQDYLACPCQMRR